MGRCSTSRRNFLKLSLAGAGAAGLSPLLGGCRKSGQGGSAEVLIGYVSPETGPLAAFGQADAFVVERVVRALNQKAPLLGGTKATFRVKVADSQSNPTRAGEAARSLITQDKADLIVVAHTPDTTNPVAAVCEASKVPCISTVAPIGPWLAGGPYRNTFHFFWDLPDIIQVFTSMWTQVPTNKVVGGLWPNDPDGVVWAKAFTERLRGAGYTVVDPGRYPNGTQDFTNFIQQWKAAKVEILTGVPIPPDWAAAWRQCIQHGFRPRIATIGKAVLFPAAVEAIGGDLSEGLSSEVWWSPEHPFKSSLTGESARDLADAYPRQWTQPLGFVYALFEVAADALGRAGSKDKAKVTEALARTRLDTLVGHIRFDEQHVSRTPLVGGQWVKGKKHPWDLRIVFNGTAPAIPRVAELRPIGS